MDHEEYLKRRDELLSIRTDSFASFDKAILSLATGSLALSITFLDKIGAPFSKSTYVIIVSAWIAFFMVILCNLASYHLARCNMDRKIANLNNRYINETKTGNADESPEPVFWQHHATNICNSAAFVAFTIGVLLLINYIIKVEHKNYHNIPSPISMEVTMNEKKQILNEGNTETPKAVSKPVVKVVRPSGDTNTHGVTESPQAVTRPNKPSGDSGGDSKKSD